MTNEIKYYESGTNVNCDCKEKSCGCGTQTCECENQGTHDSVNGQAQQWNSDINAEELQEIYHDAVLGKISVEILRPLSQDRTFKNLLTKQYDGYAKISRKMENYAQTCNVELKDPTSFAKGMMYCTTMMNTVKDKSNSKLAEIMIQGINMGIISLTKISNKLENEGKTNDLVNEMSDLLQEYLSQTKEFL